MQLPQPHLARLLGATAVLALVFAGGRVATGSDRSPIITALDAQDAPASAEPSPSATEGTMPTRQSPQPTPTPSPSTATSPSDQELASLTAAPSGFDHSTPAQPTDDDAGTSPAPTPSPAPSDQPGPVPTWGGPVEYPTWGHIDQTGVPHFTFKCDPPAGTPSRPLPELALRPGESLQVDCTFTSHNGFSAPIMVQCLTGESTWRARMTTCEADPLTVTPPPDGTVPATLTYRIPETYQPPPTPYWCPGECAWIGLEGFSLTPGCEGCSGIADGRVYGELDPDGYGWGRMDWLVRVVLDEPSPTPSPTPY